MRAAIIGCGAISATHADALVKQRIHIAALCDCLPMRAESVKEQFNLNCPVFPDYREMLDTIPVDVVHICTPHHLHAPMAVYALGKNIHALIEKPVGIRADEVAVLKAAAAQSKAQAGVCFQNRYLDCVAAAAEFLKDKKIQGLTGTVMWSRDKDYYTNSGWRGQKQTEGGGVLINQAIHTIDLMQLLGGFPVSLTATVSNRHLVGTIDVEDTAECYWETQNGSAVLYATTAASKNYPVNIKIDADGHTVEINAETCVVNGAAHCLMSGSHRGKDYWGTGHYNLIRDFYDCISTHKIFPVGIGEAARALDIVLAIYRSNGKKIEM